MTDAIQVTEKNINEVAQRFNGRVVSEDRGSYIKFDMMKTKSHKRYAFYGDWIVPDSDNQLNLMTETAYRMLAHNATHNVFDAGDHAWDAGLSVDPRDQIRGSGR